MAYRIEVPKRATRALERLAAASHRDYLRIDDAIRALAANPRPNGCKKLRGRGPLFRIKVGDYRVIYAVFDPDRLVKIEEVSRRNTNSYKER
ncbi:MAG: type II toxin-antitoxin system RelE/ParE family toxin [Chloroflexota bacterium]